MRLLSLTAAALAAESVVAVQQGFNYGATNNDGSCRTYDNFKNQFNRASSLAESGFTSARLYTSVQCGSDNAPIEAIKAALDTNTNLLLGVWASAGQSTITNEIIALKAAAKNWPKQMKKKVVGISVGSEDLYRSSPQGKKNNAGVGATAAELVDYIKQVRKALKGTALEGVNVGHVDTWTGWQLGTSEKVVDAVDFLGHNGFPWFETTRPNNAIGNALDNFNAGLSVTENASKGKPVWITETGWPSKGKQSGQAVANIKNEQTYWRQIGCPLFGKRNIFWYTLYDANTAQTDLSFSVVNPTTNEAKFSLKCPA